MPKVRLKRATSTSPPRQSSIANAGKVGSTVGGESQEATTAPAAHSAPTRRAPPPHRFPILAQRLTDITREDDNADRAARGRLTVGSENKPQFAGVRTPDNELFR
jgi:hypothetical protein